MDGHCHCHCYCHCHFHCYCHYLFIAVVIRIQFIAIITIMMWPSHLSDVFIQLIIIYFLCSREMDFKISFGNEDNNDNNAFRFLHYS